MKLEFVQPVQFKTNFIMYFINQCNRYLSEIQKLVLSGRMGEAIETTQQLYPSLLERNPDLLFMLK